MVVITVLSANGERLKEPLRASFDAAGGTIGRAPTNHLPLPDPDRTLSRVHAQIVQRQGVYRVISRGANELIVDGATVELGEEVSLHDGSLLQMGSYTLGASLVSAPAPDASGAASPPGLAP